MRYVTSARTSTYAFLDDRNLVHVPCASVPVWSSSQLIARRVNDVAHHQVPSANHLDSDDTLPRVVALRPQVLISIFVARRDLHVGPHMWMSGTKYPRSVR